jgi:RimJ/RimL family protein N-acetyltransferase
MTLRPATLADAETLLSWRNDPLTQAMSRRSRVFTMEEYLPEIRGEIFIAEKEGRPVGVIRLERDVQALWELSYTTSPEYRAQGVATGMILEVMKRYSPLIALIKPENSASIRIVEKLGFTRSQWPRDGLLAYTWFGRLKEVA